MANSKVQIWWDRLRLKLSLKGEVLAARPCPSQECAAVSRVPFKNASFCAPTPNFATCHKY